MARAIEQIERDIAALEEAISANATDLRSAYAGYLTALGQATRQQLILASYHLCTQGYPERFLSLSFSQRQQLQQAIWKLGQCAAELLLAHIKPKEERFAQEGEREDDFSLSPPLSSIPKGDSENPEENLLPESFCPSGAPPVRDWSHNASSLEDTGMGGEMPQSPAEANHPSLSLAPSASSANQNGFPDLRKVSVDSIAVGNLYPTLGEAPKSNPIELAQWQQNLEMAIAHTLKTLSRDTNRLLQQGEILPKNLPEPLLEAAAKAEAASEAMPGPPNLLNLLLETASNEQESEGSSMTHIIAIHLRLSEIEFADATVRARRNQIRSLLLKASSQGRDYHKKQREWAVAQAEAAWRASWFEA